MTPSRDDVLEEAAQVADREANAIHVAIMTRGRSMDVLLKIQAKANATAAERLARNIRALKSRGTLHAVTIDTRHPDGTR